MSLKIKDLPPDIKTIAYLRANQQNRIINEEKFLHTSFAYNRTIEKDIWYEVAKNNFIPFYEFHKIRPLYNKDYLPKQYEEVEVSSNNIDWFIRIFLTYNKLYLNAPFVTYDKQTLCAGNWPYCRSKQLFKMTKEEAEKELSQIKNKKVVIQ